MPLASLVSFESMFACFRAYGRLSNAKLAPRSPAGALVVLLAVMCALLPAGAVRGHERASITAAATVVDTSVGRAALEKAAETLEMGPRPDPGRDQGRDARGREAESGLFQIRLVKPVAGPDVGVYTEEDVRPRVEIHFPAN